MIGDVSEKTEIEKMKKCEKKKQKRERVDFSYRVQNKKNGNVCEKKKKRKRRVKKNEEKERGDLSDVSENEKINNKE